MSQKETKKSGNMRVPAGFPDLLGGITMANRLHILSESH